MSETQELTALLFAAKKEKFGRKITTSSPERLRQKLYKIRKTDPAFNSIGFKISPDNPEGELWIINKPEEPNG